MTYISMYDVHKYVRQGNWNTILVGHHFIYESNGASVRGRK